MNMLSSMKNHVIFWDDDKSHFYYQELVRDDILFGVLFCELIPISNQHFIM